jgi:hypothetical protein
MFSLKRISITDHASAFAEAVIFSCWALFFFIKYVGYVSDGSFWEFRLVNESDIFFYQRAAIICTVLAIVFLAWRFLFFYELYKNGIEVTGNICVSLPYSSLRTEYKYTYQNKKYLIGNALTPLASRKHEYLDGEEVTLLVNPKNPKRAVIKELYF